MKPRLLHAATLAESVAGSVSVCENVDLSSLPHRIDRRAAADLVTKLYFPVSSRTIEAWPLVVRHVNGRALLTTSELLSYAKAKVDAAPAIRGGRRMNGAGS